MLEIDANVQDRKMGCFYGLAIGDALGAAVEFKRPGSFEPVTGFRANGPHNLNDGEWTDDTSMALALADSLAKGFNEKDQLLKYLSWFQHGEYSVTGKCFDIGNATRASLARFASHGITTAPKVSNASGNGSIMRLAPIAIRYCYSEDLVKKAIASSETTHGNSLCTSACALMATILAGLIRGETKESVLNPEWNEIKKLELHPNIQEIADGSYKHNNVKGSGYVVESLEAALWAFWSGTNFLESTLKAVNLGDDADTTGAIAGQFSGALYGYSRIPIDLIAGLAKKDMINKYLEPIL